MPTQATRRAPGRCWRAEVDMLPGNASDTLLRRGDVAEWLRSGLQSRVHRFDSGRRLLNKAGVAGVSSGRGSSCAAKVSLLCPEPSSPTRGRVPADSAADRG